MNLQQAMDYAINANEDKECIVHIGYKGGLFYALNLIYMYEEDEEYTGPWFSIEYTGGGLIDVYCGEEDFYGGADIDELKTAIAELSVLDIADANFNVYPCKFGSGLIMPYIYRELLPELVPDWEQVTDLKFYKEHLQNVINYVNHVEEC